MYIVNLMKREYNKAIGKFGICCTALSWIMVIRRNGWYGYWKERLCCIWRYQIYHLRKQIVKMELNPFGYTGEKFYGRYEFIAGNQCNE